MKTTNVSWCERFARDNNNDNNKRMQQISTERLYDLTRLGGQSDSLGFVQEISI